MSQTAYNMTGPESISGMLDDASGSPKNIVTRNNPAVEIPFGRAVAKIVGDDDGIKLPDGAGVTLEGVCLESRAVPEGSATLDSAWPVKSAVPVIRRGRVRVFVEEAVTPADSVFVRHTVNGALNQLGAFRKDNDGGKALAFTEAKYVKSAIAGEMATVDVNLP